MTHESHVSAFLDALHSGERDTLGKHLAANVTLKSPIFETPFEGRETVLAVLNVLLTAVDSIEIVDTMSVGDRTVVFVQLRVGDVTIEGVDSIRTAPDGNIQSMTIMWRPLPAVVHAQQRIAPLIGKPAMELKEIASETES